MTEYINIPPFLTYNQIAKLYNLSLASPDFKKHNNTISGTESDIYYLNITDGFIQDKVMHASLMKMEPNAIQDWHTDFTRSTALIYPLSPNYQLGQVESGYYSGPVLLNVSKAKHAVFNNNAVRINFNVGLNIPIDQINISETIDLIKKWI